MLELVVAAGLLVGLAVGGWGLYVGRLSRRGGRAQLFIDDVTYLTGDGFRDVLRSLSPASIANLVIAALETLLLAIATLTVLELATRPDVPGWFVAGATAALVVGGYLLGRAVYVRVGFAVPETTTGVDEFGAGFERVAGTAAARDFTAIHDALGRARGGDDSDAATAAVLAAARAGVDREELRSWAAESGLASSPSVDARVDELAAAGVLDDDAFALVEDRLADADPADVAAVATTLTS